MVLQILFSGTGSITHNVKLYKTPMKSRLLIFCKYSRMGASSRLRTLQYVPYLEQNGFEIRVCSLYDDDYLTTYYQTKRRSVLKVLHCYGRRLWQLRHLRRGDLLYIEKELFPYLPAVVERALSLWGVRYVVDYDDAVFHNYDASNNRWVRWLLGKKIDVVMKYARTVLVGNEYLAQRARNAGAQCIKSIPTVVDIERYPAKTPTGPKEVARIGWIGSPYTQKYLHAVAEPLRQLQYRRPFELILVGANEQVLPYLNGISVTLIPWTEASEVEHIQSFDIGIMPLPDEKFEHGKCGYKLIQYMACGVPVVASDIGVNREIVCESQAGVLVDAHTSWQEAIEQLLSQQPFYQQCGENARTSVTRCYSMQVQQQRLHHWLRAL